MYNYDVFISRKEEDKEFAKIIYDLLVKNGLRVFESNHTLREIGNSDYRKVIDDVLVSVRHMIVVTSSPEYVSSEWVEAEWGFFILRKRSGKSKGNIFTVLANNMKLELLPPSLAYYSAILLDPKSFNEILSYINTYDIQKSENSFFQHENELGNQAYEQKDYKKAFEHFKKAAENGDAASQTNLGYQYFHGQGVFQNINQAMYWYLEAAKNQNIVAMKNIALIYEYGQGGISTNHNEAYKWYLKAADLGDAEAQLRLGIYCYDGKFFSKHYQLAFNWFDKASKKNDDAMNYLGILYEYGYGVIADPQKAFLCYSAASKNAHLYGTINMARAYDYGIGTPPNYFSALNFYSKAAKLGDVASAITAATMYYEGTKVAQDPYEAAYHFALAADLGSDIGMYRLGLMYLNGFGVTKSLPNARELFIESAKKGNLDAKKLI